MASSGTPTPAPKNTVMPQFGNPVNLGNMGVYAQKPQSSLPMFGNPPQFPTIPIDPTLQPFGNDMMSLLKTQGRR